MSPSRPGVRTATPSDAAALVPLLHELGYQVSAGTLSEKLTRLCASSAGCVLIAALEAPPAPLGLIVRHVLEPLHTAAPLGRISALVVAASHRRQGIGARLIEAAERFFRERGCLRLEVTSAAHRQGAHAFYLGAGFVETSRRFVKSL